MLRGTDTLLIDDLTPLEHPALGIVADPARWSSFSRGLIPRDYSESAPPGLKSAPSSMVVIPQSEWPERIREKEATHSALSHIKNFPALDQDGQGYSFEPGTEFLTPGGWVRVEDWNKTDLLATVNPTTFRMEFQSAVASHCYEYDGEMYHSTNRRLDFAVTDNHQMLVRKWDERRRTLSSSYSMQRADQLGWYVGMMPAPLGGQIGMELVEVAVPGGRGYYGDDFLAMLSLIISDGFAGGSESTRSLTSFCCFNPERYGAAKALAARVGFTEQNSRQGVFNCRCPALAAWVRENCYGSSGTGARNKRLPQIVKETSARQIRCFLSWYGDQHRGSPTQFYSVSKRLVDDLQELHLRIGKRSHIGASKARIVRFDGNASGEIRTGPGFVLTVSDTDRLCIDRKKHIETDRYRGPVYCASVPNGSLVTRYKDSVLISHNCWAYSTTGAVMMVRARNHQPYVRLSAHAVACKIKGFRDEGGWCGLSAEWQKDKGCPSVDFWPEKSMSRSNDNLRTWENAALHRVTEDWIDLSTSVYNRNLTTLQHGSCLLRNDPCPSDYNWWGHSVCALDVVDGVSSFDAQLLRHPDSGKLLTRLEFDVRWAVDLTAGFGRRILNSWTEGWGTNGMGVLAGTRAMQNSAVCLLVTGGSVT